MPIALLLPLALAALLFATGAEAQTLARHGDSVAARRATAAPAIRVAHGVRVQQGSPVIDGRLDDAAWAQARAVTGFVQMRPSPGTAATEATEARVLYDDEAVYVGMRLSDREPAGIAAQLARRDASNTNSDWAHVLIDSYHDRRTGFRFSVNPRGVQKDVLHFNDFEEDLNWDAVWSAATTVDSLGWTAEFRIPLSQLRFSPAAEGERVWGVNFGREIARRGEWAWWSPVLPGVGGTVSQAGELRGIEGIRAPRRLEILPYSVGRVTRAPLEAGNPFHGANDGDLALGADLKYGLTSNLTLSATLNPDFGQVEADPSEVNLSALESFFPEKRPFFMEGANIFRFGIGTDDNSGEQLFYSRRIGRAPQRSVNAGDGWLESPQSTTILGAAKLSGKTAGGWTMGFLSAVTAAEDARLASPDGGITVEPVEPLTSYSVLSLSRDFREGRSTLGVMGTSTNRRLEGRDEFGFLRSAAYVGGVNARHRFAADTWEASAYLAASHIQGSEQSIARVQRAAGHYFQRPDADHVDLDTTRTALNGAVGSFFVGKTGGGSLRGGFGGHLRTPGLEVNDVGFMNEADQVQLFANLRYQRFEPLGVFRSFHVGINPFSMWSFGGERMYTQLGHWTNFELKNLWNGGWWMGRQFEALSTGALRGGPAVVRPGGLRYSSWLNTDRRKPLGFNFNAWGGMEEESGAWDYGVGIGTFYRPSAQVNLSVRPNFIRRSNTWQYVTQTDAAGERQYLLSHLNQRTLGLTTRLNYTISPTLSLELYAEPFVSAGEYDGFKRVTDPRAAAFADRFRSLDGALSYDARSDAYAADLDGDAESDLFFANPDFSVKQLRSNAVLRWEYRPGSTLFMVWSQGRSRWGDDGSFGLGRDLGRLFGMESGYDVPATNVLLIKLNYWLNF